MLFCRCLKTFTVRFEFRVEDVTKPYPTGDIHLDLLKALKKENPVFKYFSVAGDEIDLDKYPVGDDDFKQMFTVGSVQRTKGPRVVVVHRVQVDKYFKEMKNSIHGMLIKHKAL